MNKADKDKVIAALTIGMSWAAAGKSDSAVTFCDEAISIMRGLAEDADLLALFATSQKQLPLDAVISATPPESKG